jgi:hypothetical protein
LSASGRFSPSSAVTNAICDPSGLQASCWTPFTASVMRRASPPRMDMTQICRLASFSAEALARKASRCPSGDQRGEATPRRSNASGRRAPVATSTTTSSGSQRLSFVFARDTTSATDFASGEIWGSDGRAMRARSAGW